MSELYLGQWTTMEMDCLSLKLYLIVYSVLQPKEV